MNYAGEMVSVEDRGKIVLDPRLSVWMEHGFAVPEDLINFREQEIGHGRDRQIAMVIVWKPAAKEKP